MKRLKPHAWAAQRPPIPSITVAVVFIVTALAGCSSHHTDPPDRIRQEVYSSGDDQFGMYGQPLEKPLRVMVEGPLRRGLLGGKGQRHPLPNVNVTFAVENAESGAKFDDSDAPQTTAVTDSGGVAGATLRLGDIPGDVRVVASVETPRGTQTARFRSTAGVLADTTRLEGPTGASFDDITLTLYDSPGVPASGVTVYFRAEGGAHNGSSARRERVLTNEEGRATTTWTLGEETQQYYLIAEIQDNRPGIAPERLFHCRHFVFEAIALNKKGMLVNLFGGLAVFIFGMKLMSGGLQRMADRRLKTILGAVTRNRWLAVGAGALATAMIQSSSATTVMVVGFVNAGLLNLYQAIGMIMGANIGTTITAQVIAFKLDALAYPCIALGLILTGLARKASYRALGESILGFGLLFLGMTTMTDILKPLRFSPGFAAWFQVFDCSPVNGMIPWKSALMCVVIGTVTTLVVQSSSATVGLVLALADQGLVSFETAVPLVLGDNIGTTITAVLASLGANRNSKRAALAHTMFNVCGATYMYLLLLLPIWKGQPVFLAFVDAITPGDVFASVPENLPRHIANAHTAFNMVNCLLFLPLISVLARICSWIVPLRGTDQEADFKYLEPHLLQSPAFALDQAVKEVAFMAQRAHKSLQEARACFHGGSDELRQSIQKREKVIDRLQKKITAYLVEVSREALEPEEAALIPKLIHAVNDAERIGDHCMDIVDLAQVKTDSHVALSPEAEAEARELETLLDAQFEACIATLTSGSVEPAAEVKQNESRINAQVAHIAEEHVKRLESGECEVQNGIVFLDYIGHLERIGDHLINIAKRAKKVVRVTKSA